MLGSLFTNFMIFTTFLFFGTILREKYLRNGRKASHIYHLLVGISFGLLGVVLLYYTFPLGSGVFADFRQFAVLVAVYLGGILSGGVATCMILIYRLVFLSGLNTASIFGAVNILVTFLIGVLVLNKHRLSFKRWMVALLLSVLTAILVFQAILHGDKWRSIGLFVIVFMVGGVIIYYMVNYLKRSEESIKIIREAAIRDHLTNLYNPRAFDRLMEQSIAHSKQQDQPLTVLLLDIDHFKKVNDTYGHSAGDAVLVQLADILRDTFRSGDHIARKGGEEFAVIIEGCDQEDITVMAERFRKNVENHCFRIPDGKRLRISVSAGTATYPAIPENQLIDQADEALYRAKNSGRNRVCQAVAI